MVSFDIVKQNPLIRYIPWTYIMGKETIETLCRIFRHLNQKWKDKFYIIDLFFEKDKVCFKLATCKVPFEILKNALNWPEGIELKFYRILKKCRVLSV